MTKDGVAPSKGAWTPGPWKAAWDADGVHMIFSSTLGRKDGLVAVTVGEPAIQHDVDVANAKLISKSPQMAELLRDFYQILDAGVSIGPLSTLKLRAERLLSELEVKP